MPQPAALDEIENPLVKVLRQAWDRVMAEQAELEFDPSKATKRKRLLEMMKSIFQLMDEVDDEAYAWVTGAYPQAYALGVTQTTGEMVWSAIHQEAVEELAQDLFQDLLEATKGVRETTKGLIRSIARDEALQSTIAGGTAQQAGRAMKEKLAAEGIHAVTYKNGSRHSLTEYSEMAMRTKTAEAFNKGTLNAHPDVRYFEVFDGPQCGLSFHDDPTAAVGLILERSDCEKYLISHPNCRRAFGPRPDILSPEEAKSLSDQEAKDLANSRIEQAQRLPDTVGAGQVTTEQLAAQVEQDTARAQVQARKAARAKKLKQPGGGLPDAKLEARATRVAKRDQALSLPDMADPSLVVAAPKIGPGDLTGEIVNDVYVPTKVSKTYNTVAEVPEVIDLIDAGLDPATAAEEHKRLVKNARNVERRARNKAKALSGAQGDLVGDDLLLPQGSQPKVLYDHLGAGPAGPGGVDRPWYDRVSEDHAPGAYTPVQNLKVEGRMVNRGIAVRRNGRSYLLEMTDTQTELDALVELDKHIGTVETAMTSVPAPFRGYQRGVAVLKGPNPDDAFWAKKYGKPDFKSNATGGHGGTTFWGTEPRPGTILHEFGHNLDSAGGMVDGKGKWFSEQARWSEATVEDDVSSEFFANNSFQGSIPGHTITPGSGGGVTSYGKVDVKEDFAESVRLYFADRFNGYTGWTNVDGQQVSTRFADLFPERAKQLDELFGLDPAPPSPLRAVALAKADKIATEKWVDALSSSAASPPYVSSLQSQTGLPRATLIQIRKEAQAKAAKIIEEKAAKEAAAAAAEAAELAKQAVLVQLQSGKLTTEGLSFSDKTSVGLKKNNAYKKAIAQGKTEAEATEIATKVEQETIALKKGIDPALLTKAAQAPDPIVTVADLTTGDKVGIGVKKSNAFKKATNEGKSYSEAEAIANEVEAKEIETRLARIKAERKLSGGFSTAGPSEASTFRPEFVSGNRTRAQTHIRKAGSERHPKALQQPGRPQQAKANIAAELGSRMNNPEDWARLQKSGMIGSVGHAGIKLDGVAFDACTEAERQEVLDAIASQLIQGWAQSSGDSHVSPMAMQRAIAEEFGVKGDPYVRASAARRIDADKMYERRGELYRSFVRHQYEHTQEEFARAGITEISVYRGMNLDPSVPWANTGIHEPDLQPANSWSTNDSISLRFGSTFLTGTVPVDRVLGSCRTGFGCYNEYEIVVLATPGKVRVNRNYYQGMIK